MALIARIALGDGAGNGGPGRGVGLDTALVGKWYASQEAADVSTGSGIFGVYYEFTSDGYIVMFGSSVGITYTASGGGV